MDDREEGKRKWMTGGRKKGNGRQREREKGKRKGVRS